MSGSLGTPIGGELPGPVGIGGVGTVAAGGSNGAGSVDRGVTSGVPAGGMAGTLDDGAAVAGTTGSITGPGVGSDGSEVALAGITGGVFTVSGAGIGGRVAGAGGVITGLDAGADATGISGGDAPLVGSLFGHCPANAANPPSEIPNTPAISFQRDKNMLLRSSTRRGNRGTRGNPYPRGRRI